MIWLIRRPGNRAGWELWLGPLGLALTWPPLPLVAWNWGWWRHIRIRYPRPEEPW